MLLAGYLSDEFEVGVVVEDSQPTCFGDRRDQRIDERQRPVLALGRQRRLDLEGPLVVCVGHRDQRERLESLCQGEVVVVAPGGVAQLEDDR